MLRRILGLIILVASVVVLVLLLATAYYIRPALDAASVGADSGLALTVDTLGVVSETLEQTQATLVSVNDTMTTAETTTANLATAIEDTIPLLDQIGVVVAEQIPENVENFQAAVPNIAAVAGVVDTALVRLSDFSIDQTIPIPFNPIEINYDLGIDYNPEVPFDESITALGTGLDGLPEELRSLRAELEISAANLQTISENLQLASGDVGAINVEVARFIPLLDDYLVILDQVIDATSRLRVQIAQNLSTIKTIATILPLALAITQLAPLVVGWELLTGNRDKTEVVQEEEEYADPEPEVVAVVEQINDHEERVTVVESEDKLELDDEDADRTD